MILASEYEILLLPIINLPFLPIVCIIYYFRPKSISSLYNILNLTFPLCPFIAPLKKKTILLYSFCIGVVRERKRETGRERG